MSRKKKRASYVNGVLTMSIVIFLVLKFIFKDTWLESLSISLGVFLILFIVSKYRYRGNENGTE
ncbi:hypothetical protein BMT55_01900 [Listeria newyorkensis]|uniref:Uncharacterized protein n=1 Tax=Listeria newyorkensis TaxID=1497681 RepID=A0ABX4XQG5_9LIST|nr:MULTISPECIES: hypothetical protein [Listeria]KGL45793.1 hypothetical protein EP56_03645 [Listeriaceae bacterium FSL A5-0209]KGL41827.1 hypothetical protein EP58_09780 [Listeria newyorkensis]KMT58288.1 hypothetical protein X559_3045 [Listeria newyorkensis]PNP94264.1 hypothetical protein BMT55_01900 [Listeria newyorkensis]RQW67778.1 hypothetical protein DUK53_05530 [Listeria sp. SHR_NRA_18]